MSRENKNPRYCRNGEIFCTKGSTKPKAMLIVCVSSFIRTIPSVSEFHRLGKQIACSWTFTTGGEFHSAPKTTVIILYAEFRICQYLFSVLRYFFVSSSILKLSTHFRIILLKVALSSEFDFMYRIVCSLHFASDVATSHALAILT